MNSVKNFLLFSLIKNAITKISYTNFYQREWVKKKNSYWKNEYLPHCCDSKRYTLVVQVNLQSRRWASIQIYKTYILLNLISYVFSHSFFCCTFYFYIQIFLHTYIYSWSTFDIQIWSTNYFGRWFWFLWMLFMYALNEWNRKMNWRRSWYYKFNKKCLYSLQKRGNKRKKIHSISTK